MTRAHWKPIVMVLFTLQCITLLVGCSVLTIDVEAYKGPLANHEAVRVQQVAVMAIGAKPLLTELRDRLEWEGEEDRKYRREEAMCKKWYRQGYVKPTREGQYNWFENESAQNVNEILGLYEDLTDEGLDVFVQKGRLALESYFIIRRKLETETKQDREFYQRIISQAKKGNCCLLMAFKRLLCPSMIRDSWREPSPSFFDANDTAYTQDDALGKWYALLEEDIVTKRLDVLLGKQRHKELKNDVEGRLKALAALAIEARSELQKAIRIGLEFMILANSPSFQSSIKDLSALNKAVASVLAQLIQPRKVDAALKMPGLATGLRDSLRSRWMQAISPQQVPDPNNLNWESNENTGLLYDALPKAIEKTLVEEPLLTAMELLQLHDAFISMRDCDTGYGMANDKRYRRSQSRRTGLARGTSLGERANADPLLRDANNKLQELIRDLQETSLSGGRLNPGIESLMESFLNALHLAPRRGDEAVYQAEQDLLLALVRFATKVLEIADNYGLLFYDMDKDSDLQSFALLLQSVGNSIVVQVNELIMQREHLYQNKDRWKRELDSVRAVLERNDYKQFDSLFSRSIDSGGEEGSEGSSTPRHTDDGTPDPRDVTDKLIAALRYELALLVREGKPEHENRITGLKDALDLLYRQRAGMTYITSPLAYLRSSTTATGLTNNRTVWRNKLSEHAKRALPQCVADDPNGTRIREKIDSQYWQSINRVRVAAVVRSNYVIAKDVTGNWYVKGYSGDPRPLIEAGKQVALYAAGAGAGAPLLSTAGSDPNRADTGSVRSAAGTDNDLDQLLSRYRDEAMDDFDDLRDYVNPIRATLTDAWRRDEQIRNYDIEFITLLGDDSNDVPILTQLKATLNATPSTDIHTFMGQLLDAISVLRLFRDTLTDDIAELPIDNNDDVLKARHDRDIAASQIQILGERGEKLRARAEDLKQTAIKRRKEAEEKRSQFEILGAQTAEGEAIDADRTAAFVDWKIAIRDANEADAASAAAQDDVTDVETEYAEAQEGLMDRERVLSIAEAKLTGAQQAKRTAQRILDLIVGTRLYSMIDRRQGAARNLDATLHIIRDN